MNINGILNVNKTEGITSFRVVSQLKRITGQRHVGHTGTLDPMATGVLPVCLGQATRISGFLIDSEKTYIAEIELGISTDTYDREGKVIQKSDASAISAGQVEKALKLFTGTIEQVPPMFSAIKYHGQKLYQLARSGVNLKPHARKVTINRIEILSMELPVVSIEVDCSKGTYLRSLAYDLGQKLGCGAYLRNLVRTRSGSFYLKDAAELPTIEKAFHDGGWENLLYPIDYPLTRYKKADLNGEQQNQVIHGLSAKLDLAPEPADNIIRAYGSNGQFLAMLKYNAAEALWHPYKVFYSPAAE